MFTYKYTPYIYDSISESFYELKYNYHLKYGDLLKMIDKVPSEFSVKRISKLYGKGLMDIEMKPIYRILTEDVLNSFYMFQCFGLVAWFISGIWKYGGTLGLMLSLSIYGELSTIYWNLKMLRQMAHYECPVTVRRKNSEGRAEWRKINSSHIIPGEILMLPEGKDMPGDAILLKGEGVINEAMLTGESAPSVKTGVPNNSIEVENFSVENKEQVS